MKRFDKPNLLSSPIKWFNYTFKLTPTEQHILNFLHEYEEVKETNEEIQKGQRYVVAGLCCIYGPSLFRPIVKQWPKFSGNVHYPVPHPTTDAKTGFFIEQKKSALVDRYTQYGRDRLELSQFVVDYFEQTIEKAKRLGLISD